MERPTPISVDALREAANTDEPVTGDHRGDGIIALIIDTERVDFSKAFPDSNHLDLIHQALGHTPGSAEESPYHISERATETTVWDITLPASTVADADSIDASDESFTPQQQEILAVVQEESSTSIRDVAEQANASPEFVIRLLEKIQ